MPLKEHHSAFQNAKAEHAQAKADLLLTGENVQRLESRLRSLERSFDPQNTQQVELRNKLREQLEEAKTKKETGRDKVKDARGKLVGLYGSIAPLLDPREAVSTVPANMPILLLPLRIETRFQFSGAASNANAELLVRVYPDDALIDTFEATLSTTEVESAQRFWSGWWKSQGDANMRRSYWRELVAALGSGRGRYAVQNHVQLATSDPEPAANTADVMLIVPTFTALVGIEKDAMLAHNVAAWKANGDATKLGTAFAQLEGATSAARAQVIATDYAAFNFKDEPPAGKTRDTASVQARQIVFTDPATLELRNTAWASQPKVDLLPERLVLVLEKGNDRQEIIGSPIVTPLAVGPDPRAPKEEQYQPDANGDMVVPEEQRWLMDFDAALKVGMAFRVALNAVQASTGFDRVYVLGARLAGVENGDSKAAFEQLIQHHHESSSGFAVIPQGTPTNRTEDDGTEAVWRGDDGFDAFMRERTANKSFDMNDHDAWSRKDGAVLIDALGIGEAVLQPITGTDGKDTGEARAMNAALWPATMGYWMDTMMNTVFSDAAIGRTRGFFEEHVTGRGALPAVRIGDQPYGILPTTAFSHMAFAQHKAAQEQFVEDLYGKLALLRQKFWDDRGDNAAHVTQVTDDPQQLLLDILGLHPASVEYHQQWAQSIEEFWNRLTLSPGFDTNTWNAILSVFFAPALLAELGHAGDKPDLLDKIFTARPIDLNKWVIDDRPSSESEGVRDWTTDDKNYLEWLASTAATSLDALRKEEGFLNNTPPNTLLYLLLKHALELGLYHAGLKYRAAVLPEVEVKAMRRESPFIHIDQKPASESRYAVLYDTDVRFTGGIGLTVADRIATEFNTAPATEDVRRQRDAVAFLADVPTARLERLFAEHLDVCTHRLDAWLLGVVRHRLTNMREQRPTGLAIGAYGYVEALKPKPRPTHHKLTGPETTHFGNIAVIDDPLNEGFIHALSPDHATTAAILRNGHARNAVPSQPDLLAIDLSSERVRIALGLIEGLRTGQSLGALLGYRFERGLHDRGGTLELDEFIFPIRLAFPLRANKQSDTAVEDGSIETIEARNVVDGLALVEHIRSSGHTQYPWNKDLPTASSAEAAAIDAEVEKLHAALDAMADLSLAESIHQLARGNTERAAAAMDMVSKGTYPVQPDVVRTPRSGATLTHRIALHLDAGAGAGGTPRGILEPAVNDWLKKVLPPLGDIVLRVGRAVQQADGSETVTGIATVSWSDLSLDAIDLLHLLDMHSEQGMNAIDDRVRHHVYTTPGLVAGITPDWDVRMIYTESVANKFTLFELAPLIESLRLLVFGVKAWSPSEAMLSNEAGETISEGVVDRVPVQNARNAMKLLRDDIATHKAAMDGPLADPVVFLNILNVIDAALLTFIQDQKSLGSMGVALAGFGGVIEAKRAWFERIRTNAEEHDVRWQAKLDLCDAKLTAASDPALNDFAKVELLKEAEAAVSTIFTRTGALTLPLTPGPFALHIDGLRTAFIVVKTRLTDIATNTFDRFVDLYAAWENVVNDMDDHDPTAIDLQADRTPLIALLQDMSRQLSGTLDDLQKRLDAADSSLLASDAKTGKAQADLRIQAAKALFGDDLILIPRHTMSATQVAEWNNSSSEFAARETTATGLGIERPTDEWLYGTARVRNKCAAIENAQVMCEAFNVTAPRLAPMQFPHVPGEPWLAVQWPSTFDANVVTERLLYTAIHANGAFAGGTGPHCGLMLDEWTETIPAKNEVTSVAFHYDRPSTEAPQTWLLTTPASTGTNWNWADLRDTIPDTMKLARMRAIEPGAFDDSVINRFLPATIAAVTTRRVTIGVDLARNVNSEAHFNAILPNA